MIDWGAGRVYLVCACSGPEPQGVVLPLAEGHGQCPQCGRCYQVQVSVTAVPLCRHAGVTPAAAGY